MRTRLHRAATAPWPDVWALSSQVCTAGHAIVRASHAGPAPGPSSLNLSTPVPVQFNGEALVLALHTANAVHALRRIEPFDVAAEHGLLQHVAVDVSSQQATLACKHRHHTPDKSLIALCSSLLIGIGSGTSSLSIALPALLLRRQPQPCLILLFNYSSTSMSEASDAKSRSALATGQMPLCRATQNNPAQTLRLAAAGSRSQRRSDSLQ